MEQHQHFRVGDRVLLREPYMGLTVGVTGTVLHIYSGASEFCRVRFDTVAVTFPTPERLLAPDRPPQRQPAPGAARQL